ncbi:MAG: citrate synthase [Halothermotrichaceae bacterium]
MELSKKLTEKYNENCFVGTNLYQQYDVKNGLRNPDGTGVKTVLTEISDVTGYEKDEAGNVTPVEGRLRYRGIEIKDLVKGFLKEKRDGFAETAYLLMFGEQPCREDLKEFTDALAEERFLSREFVQNIILPFPSKDIMNKLQTAVTVFYRTDKVPDDISTENVIRQCMNLIAKLPTVVAYSYLAKQYKHYSKTLYIHNPSTDLTTAENFLHLLREDQNFTDLEAEVLDIMLVLHADHSGGNNSTFTNRVVSSTHTDTYSAIVAALGSLKGPLHGGANLKCVRMMDDIKEYVNNIDSDGEVFDYLMKIVKGEAGDRSGKIWGMGHAVYTLSDPRAVMLKAKARDLAQQKGKIEEFELYERVERLTRDVLADYKGVDRENIVISPNVDFYSALVYDLMNFPRDIFPAMFAMSRIAGWSAHRIEQLECSRKLIRPASVYAGPEKVDFKPINQRK